MKGSRELLLERLTADQKKAVRSDKRRLLVVAGAGSGKTEVMARRIAWWVGIKGVPKDRIIAFTFTERAAEEMKFRIRGWIERITPDGEDVSLGGMYVGTIHGFCLAKIREFWPDQYHNYDILDEGGRASLILRGFNGLLGLRGLQSALALGQYATLDAFIRSYDLLHEHDCFDVKLSADDAPFRLGEEEQEWCKQADLRTMLGKTPAAQAFKRSAARYYAYIRCRRFLDFSTSQTEFIRRLRRDSDKTAALLTDIHLMVDEVQDINPVQYRLIERLVGKAGHLTAVGDHRQAIYGFRGANVGIVGTMWEQFKKAPDANVIDMQENFRSTERIIELANRWATTISRLRSMKTPPMKHGNIHRKDRHPSHMALIGFSDRRAEASWIAEAVRALVPSEYEGAVHDKKEGLPRGLALSDLAILVRSSTDVRTYMQALESAGIACVVRAGPDLFSQPEVLLLLAALAISAGIDAFYGADQNPKSLPNRIRGVLGCDPKPQAVLKSAAKLLRSSGLTFERSAEERLLFSSRAIRRRISENASFKATAVAGLRTPKLREFLTGRQPLRRVFPQQLFHYLLSEAQVESWDTCEGRGQSAMFHLGALSSLITGIETPGWTSARDYHWQIIGLCQFGSESGRVEEQPLMVQPDAVTISTIHGVKGLEFPAIFLADVQAQRFPSSNARRKPRLPLDGEILKRIDLDGLADNENYDSERRLMYVALTRAERFLFVSHSGTRTSTFIKELTNLFPQAGGLVTDDAKKLLHDLEYAPKEHRRDIRLSTSFSDLRYYLECPHDFYLRKVLGFAPTIDQAFGYGRGVHNLLRAVHSNPKKWAELARDRSRLESEIQRLVDQGLFYLRYTTGDPAENMRKKGIRVVADYIAQYADELSTLRFEPEKEFETLIEYEDGDGGALVAGAIDVVRQDNPPRVTLIDFKSGDPDSDNHQKLDEQEMRLQVAVYGVAARKELQYLPEQGLVRYLDASDAEKRELEVPLDDKAIADAKKLVAVTAAQIRDRQFREGPKRKNGSELRCGGCDFVALCGSSEAMAHKTRNPRRW